MVEVAQVLVSMRLLRQISVARLLLPLTLGLQLLVQFSQLLFFHQHLLYLLIKYLFLLIQALHLLTELKFFPFQSRILLQALAFLVSDVHVLVLKKVVHTRPKIAVLTQHG